MVGGLDLNPLGDEDCKSIAAGTFASCDSVAAANREACKGVVAACSSGDCNVVSIWKSPSCHTDVSAAYKYCYFHSCQDSFLDSPDLDGHCDEAVGCQGTFYSLARRGSLPTLPPPAPTPAPNGWKPLGDDCEASYTASGSQCLKCAGIPKPSNPSCRMVGGLDLNPLGDEDCKSIAAGTFASCDSVAAANREACKGVVAACSSGDCNVVSIWKSPSCHTDVSAAYKYCYFHSCQDSFLDSPDLDGHCDEAVGCQGTFYTLGRQAAPSMEVTATASIPAKRLRSGMQRNASGPTSTR